MKQKPRRRKRRREEYNTDLLKKIYLTLVRSKYFFNLFLKLNSDLVEATLASSEFQNLGPWKRIVE